MRTRKHLRDLGSVGAFGSAGATFRGGASRASTLLRWGVGRLGGVGHRLRGVVIVGRGRAYVRGACAVQLRVRGLG